MLDFGSNPIDRQLLLSAQFLHKELPVRLAHRVAELENLPYGLSGKVPVLKVCCRKWTADSSWMTHTAAAGSTQHAAAEGRGQQQRVARRNSSTLEAHSRLEADGSRLLWRGSLDSQQAALLGSICGEPWHPPSPVTSRRPAASRSACRRPDAAYGCSVLTTSCAHPFPHPPNPPLHAHATPGAGLVCGILP